MRKAAPKKVGIYIFEVVSGNPERIGEKYVGQAKRDARERENYHWNKLKNDEHSNKMLQNYYNKYGKDSLKYTFIFKSPENELNFWEKFWIKCFDSYEGDGFNLTAGGTEAVHQYKPCIFKNMKTGEIVESESRKHFASKYGFCHASVNELVNGGMYYLGDWIYLLNENKIKKHKLISPDGKEYEIYDGKIKEFCKEMGLIPNAIHLLLCGKSQFSKGWHRPDSKIKSKSDWRGCKEFKFLSPSNDVLSGNVLVEFCKNHGLNYECMSKVNTGRLEQYKGWTKYKETK